MAHKMPANVDEFCAVLSQPELQCWTGAEDDLASTDGQKAILKKLIDSYNNAQTPVQRMAFICKFLVDAANVEGVEHYRIEEGPTEGAVYLVQDLKSGSHEHNKTLAVGVLRWCTNCSGLLHLKGKRLPTRAERDAVLVQAKERASAKAEAARLK